MAQEKLEQTVNQAKKILGDDAEIPLGKVQLVEKAVTDWYTAGEDLDSKRAEQIKKIYGILDDLEEKAVEYQNLNSALENALDQAESALTTSTYRLNAADPKEKKKIDQAHTYFKNYFKNREGEMANLIKQSSTYTKNLEKIKNALTPLK